MREARAWVGAAGVKAGVRVWVMFGWCGVGARVRVRVGAGAGAGARACVRLA